MNLDQKLLARLEDLVQKGSEISFMPDQPGKQWAERMQAFTGWATSCKHTIEKVFSTESAHYRNFEQMYDEERKSHWGLLYVAHLLGILKGALEDFRHEMLFDTRTAIEAELFDDFLEQAEVLLAAGYPGPAAVIAGSVLEDALRKICQAQNLTLPDKPKLDKMNQDIAGLGAYSKQWQKRITALADTRNHAAHGQWDKFTQDDVKRMISDINDFMRLEFEQAKRFTP